MERSSETEMSDVIKELAGAFNLHIGTCNRVWLSIAVFSIAVIPTLLGQDGNISDALKLPFGLGEVKPNQYVYLGLLLTLCGLVVYFCQSWAQAIQVHRRAHEIVGELQRQFDKASMEQPKSAIGPSQQYEFLRLSTFARGGPLLHLLTTNKGQNFKSIAFIGFFLPLRLITILVAFGLPVFAGYIILSTLFGASHNCVVAIATISIVFYAVIAVLVILYEECRQSLTISDHVLKE